MSEKDIGIDVSRETIARLEHYLHLLIKWNPAINLVAKSTLDEAWERHFIDSAQIYRHAPRGWKTWADFGSGGGFPGAVLAILASELNPDGMLTLVESDQRKATFLRTVFRETSVTAQVLASRIEVIEPLNAHVISARALSDLAKLFEFAERHGSENACFLFPKGANWEKEVRAAQESWSFVSEPIISETDPNAVILKIGDLRRAR